MSYVSNLSTIEKDDVFSENQDLTPWPQMAAQADIWAHKCNRRF